MEWFENMRLKVSSREYQMKKANSSKKKPNPKSSSTDTEHENEWDRHLLFEDHIKHSLWAIRFQKLNNVRMLQHMTNCCLAFQIYNWKKFYIERRFVNVINTWCFWIRTRCIIVGIAGIFGHIDNLYRKNYLGGFMYTSSYNRICSPNCWIINEIEAHIQTRIEFSFICIQIVLP